MANRYWVSGGSGLWNGTDTNNWSATSGGPSGASVPTTADDVFFNGSSGAGAVTISDGNKGAKSINCTGFTGNLTGSSSISVAGSVTLSAGMTFDYSGTITITSTGTIISAGKSITALAVNAPGSTVTLGDAFSTGLWYANINVIQGTFDTASYSVSTGNLSSSPTEAYARSIFLRNSTVSLSGSIYFSVNTNLTFNAGTSTILMNAFYEVLRGGPDRGNGVTFHNVSFTNSNMTTVRGITGRNTFNNLSITFQNLQPARFTFSDNQTINGTLTLTGSSETSRPLLASSNIGTRTVLTCAAISGGSHFNFREIGIAGAAAPIAPTGAGDCHNNSGISFPSARTLYRVGTSNLWFDSTAWALTSGGAPSLANNPRPQDTCIIDNNCAPSGQLQSGYYAESGTISFANRTNPITLYQEGVRIYGDYRLSSAVTLANFAQIEFRGSVAQTFVSAGKDVGGVTIEKGAGTVTLSDALTLSYALNFYGGGFNTGSYAMSIGGFYASGGYTRSATLNNSTITVTNNTDWYIFDPTGMTLNTGTSTINILSGNANFYGGSFSYNNVIFSGINTGNRQIGGNNTFNNLTFNPSSSSNLSNYSLLNNQTINGTFSCNGTSNTSRVFLRSNIEGVIRTLTVASASVSYCDFKDITIAGAVSPLNVAYGGDCGNNSGIIFPAAKTVYRVGSDTSWTGVNSWSLTSGGAGSDINYPLPQDTAVIDNNTTATSINTANNAGALDTSSRTVSFQINYGATRWHGSHSYGNGVTISGSSSQIFGGGRLMLFTSNGRVLPFSVQIAAGNGTFRLNDAFSSTGFITIQAGTLDANDYNVTCAFLSASGNAAKIVNMGSGLWTLTGTSTVMSVSSSSNTTLNKGTANILLSDTGSSTRYFSAPGLSFNKLTIGGTTGSSTLYLEGANLSFTELASTKIVAHTISLASDIGTINDWSIKGSIGNVVTVNSWTPGTRFTFALANQTIDTNYLNVKDIGERNSLRFYVGANSIDSGNNSNVYFVTPPPIPPKASMLMLF
jgi:hypothetical protein